METNQELMFNLTVHDSHIMFNLRPSTIKIILCDFFLRQIRELILLTSNLYLQVKKRYMQNTCDI